MKTLNAMKNYALVLILGAMLLAALPVSATVYVKDSVVTNGADCYTLANLASQSATNSTVGLSKTAGWSATGTGVFQVDTLGLAYSDNILLDEAGSSFTVMNASTSSTDGRMLVRTMSGLPTSGSIYFSLLLRAGSGFTAALADGHSVGMGLGTWGFGGSLTSAQVSTNGVHFGFQKSGGTPSLMLRVNGTNYVMVTSPVADRTYLCVGKVELGAGPSGEDIVRAAVDPEMPDSFTLAVTNRIVSSGTTFTNMTISGTYRTNSKKGYFDEYRVGSTWSDVATVDSSSPVFNYPPTVTVNGTNAFEFSATLDQGSAETAVIACYGTTQGSASASSWGLSKLVTATPTLGSPATTELDNLVTNTSYYYAALATNANYSVLKNGGTLLMGEVWLTLGADAFEEGLVSGSAVVHRPASATQTPLTVSYTVSGSAVAGVNYVANSLSGSVTIPAGQDSVAIPIVPLVEAVNISDTTVVLTLTSGAYYIGGSNSTTVTVQNYDYPADKNCWIATTAGNASVAANWSQNRVPSASDAILLDLFSSANMTWDVNGVNGLSDTVASWTQTTNYTGVVTFPINFTNVVGAVFTNFTVTGDVVLVNGMWTHTAHTNTTTAMKKDYYRLKVTVGGNLTVASAASISATGRGSFDSYNGSGGAYGGANNYGASTVYGNPYEPENVGSSAKADDGKMGYAGGALWLEVAGNAVVAGTISANGQSVNGQWADVYSGSGGSIYLKASSLSGAGSIYANGTGSGGSKSKNCSSGGRISILLTGSEMSFPVSKIKATGESEYGNVAGAGTLVVRTPATPNGTLYVVNATSLYGQYAYRPMLSQLTPIPSNQVWTFDAVVTGDNGILSIPTGTTLNLARGFESVSSSSTERENGILIDGGNLTYPPQGTHTISNYWILQANTPYTLTGNLVVTNAAAVGSLRIYNTSTSTCAKCTFTVTGDMTVASNGYLYAVNSGYATSGSTSPMVSSGYGSHGGQNGQYTTNTTYDSILNPRHGGTFGGTAESLPQGGGVMNLTVGGTLRIDGTATAGLSDSSRGRPGGAGTFNLTAARLEGTGSINANGSIRNVKDGTYYGASGGGRISVRLTDPAATFSEYWKSAINAKGGYTSLSTLLATNSSSAGTVYLQSGSEAEAHGTVVVRNDNNVLNNLAFTPIPSRIQGGENDVFSKVSFTVEDCARIKLFETLQIASLSLEANTVIDCNGYVLTVRRMTAGGTPIARGTYVSGSSLFTSGYVRDTSAGLTGALIVIGEPSLISIR